MSSQFNIIKLQKLLKDYQWKIDASELIFECHGKQGEYLRMCFFIFNTFAKNVRDFILLCHYVNVEC